MARSNFFKEHVGDAGDLECHVLDGAVIIQVTVRHDVSRDLDDIRRAQVLLVLSEVIQQVAVLIVVPGSVPILADAEGAEAAGGDLADFLVLLGWRFQPVTSGPSSDGLRAGYRADSGMRDTKLVI